MPISIANKLPVELRPAFRFDLALKRKLDVAVSARAQLLRDEILGAGADTFLDVVPRYDKVLAIVGDAARSFAIWPTSSRAKLSRSVISGASSGDTMKRKW